MQKILEYETKGTTYRMDLLARWKNAIAKPIKKRKMALVCVSTGDVISQLL